MQTSEWVIMSIFTMLMWGVWGLLGKMATSLADWREVYIMAGLGSLIVYFLFYAAFRPTIGFHNLGPAFAFLAGVTGVAGAIVYYLALSRGEAAVVVPLTALYPVVTVILSTLFLREQVTLTQGAGITLAIVALVLVSLE